MLLCPEDKTSVAVWAWEGVIPCQEKGTQSEAVPNPKVRGMIIKRHLPRMVGFLHQTMDLVCPLTLKGINNRFDVFELGVGIGHDA